MRKSLLSALCGVLLLNTCDQPKKQNVFYKEVNHQLISITKYEVIQDEQKMQSPNGDSILMKKVMFVLVNKSNDTLRFNVNQNDSNEIMPTIFASKDKSGWEVIMCDLERTKQSNLYPNSTRRVHYGMYSIIDSIKFGLTLKGRNESIEITNFFNVRNNKR